MASPDSLKESQGDGMELIQRLCHPHATFSSDLILAENGEVQAVMNPLLPLSNTESWKTHPIEAFSSRLSGHTIDAKKAPKAVREFYRKQDAHIRELERLNFLDDAATEVSSSSKSTAEKQEARRISSIIIRTVFLVNLLLLVGKAVASVISGSLSIISSLLDSCVDLVSGGLMWYAARQMRKRRPYSYPQGRTRFEPIAIIVLAVFMGTISLQLVAESVETIVRMCNNEKGPPNVTNTALGIMATTIGIKLILWAVCGRFGSTASVRALKIDQRNDVFSNTATLVFSGLAGRLPPIIADKQFEQLKFLDPIGAILIGSYILYSWGKIGAEQTRNLAGHTADPNFIQKIAFVCLNHHAAIERLDTIRAFHFGAQFLVEVDIVLPMGMRLKEAHDIGEELQKKLERVDGVERAFVHLDYEYTHHPESEHKIA